MNYSSFVDRKNNWVDKNSTQTVFSSFTANERSELDDRFYAILMEYKCDAFLAMEPGNFTYLSGITLPYSEQNNFPQAAVVRTKNRDEDVILCPLDWAHLIVSQGWWGNMAIHTSNEGPIFARLTSEIARMIAELKLESASVGLDRSILPADLVERIEKALPDVKWVNCDPALCQLRMVKTGAEVKLLEEACRQSDRAIVSALNHMEGNIHDSLGYDIWEFTERIRVHVGEFCGSGTGNLLTLQGADASVYYSIPKRGVLTPGNLIRSEVTNHHQGYWANSGRCFVTGNPPPITRKPTMIISS
jgi:Xaa-Pro aminopeptidase